MKTKQIQLIFKGNPFYVSNVSPIKKKLVFERSYSVLSDVKEGTFQDFMNFLNNNQTLNIQKENILEYVMLNDEFGSLDEFGIDFKYISILTSKQNQDCSFYEELISRDLEKYLDNYMNQMKYIPINSLYNIFMNKNRKLGKKGEEKAYQFIKEISKDSKDYLILLQLLDGKKLDKITNRNYISISRKLWIYSQNKLCV